MFNTKRFEFAEGSVHGRFQPFHRGHLKYVLAAKERCKFLWIGVTQFDIHALANSSQPHRQEPASNPFTYFERFEMISNALKDCRINLTEFAIVPFPIDIPEIIPDFIPIRVPVFTTVCEIWNRDKIEVLEKVGYKVIILWEEAQKRYSGAIIRRLVANNDLSWREMVPKATAVSIEKYSIRARLLRLMKNT